MPIRLRAFLIHFAGSCVLALLALALVFLVWYPNPLPKAVGMAGIFFMMLGIDVVLGPLLTLIVYNPAKQSLKFDLAVIVVLQLAAFAYGMHAIAVARPAWLVFNNDRFDLVQAIDLDRRFVDKAPPEYRDAPWTGPSLVASVAPDDPERQQQLLMESVAGGSDLPQRIDLYVPLESQVDALRQRAQSLGTLSHHNDPAPVREMLARWPQADAFLPLMARVKPMTVLIRKESGSVVAVVDLRPWSD